MKSVMKWTLTFLIVLAGLPGLAQDAAPEGAMEGQGMPGMSEEQMEMMAAMQAAMTPGEPHEMLAESAGSWKLTFELWMAPGTEPMINEGTAERTMTLGGRVLEEKVSASMMGMPMEGLGRTGYNNVTDTWWSTWTDNMSTGLVTMTGTWDAEKQEMVFEGEVPSPMDGEMRTMRIVSHHEGADKEIAEFFEPGPDGEMHRTMRIVYERQ
ncbi:MAG: DUF1579 family protein [Acidobacteriota bacterium]|nr:DUF1579 family protein [Acidobacteriota bacterium]